jgi:hypothetical protein
MRTAVLAKARRSSRSNSERQAIVACVRMQSKRASEARGTQRQSRLAFAKHGDRGCPAGRAMHLVIDRKSFSRMSRLYSTCARKLRNAELKLRFAMCRMTRAIT